MVFHDQCVVVGAADLHAPVKERFQCRNITRVPFMLLVQILGVHVRVGIDSVEIHPFHSHRAAFAVTDLSHAGVGPVSFRRAVAFIAVQQHIDLHVFREDRFLHVQELFQECTFQVVVARHVDEEAPRVVLCIIRIRQALRDQAVFAVFVIGRRIHRQIVFALLQSGQADLGSRAGVSFHRIAVRVLDHIRQTVFPVAAVIRQDDLAALPRIVFQHDLERIGARFVVFHRLRDGETADRLVFADRNRLHPFVAVRRDQARIRHVPAQRVVVRNIGIVTIHMNIVISDRKILQADRVVVFRSPRPRHHFAVSVQDLKVKIPERRFATERDVVVRRAFFEEREPVVIDVLHPIFRVDMNGKICERLFAVRRAEPRRFLQRIVAFIPVRVDLMRVHVKHQLIIPNAAVLRFHSHVIHAVLHPGKRNLILAAARIQRCRQQCHSVGSVQIKVQIADLVVVGQRDRVTSQTFLRELELVIIQVVGTGNRRIERDLFREFLQMIRMCLAITGFNVVRQNDLFRQIVHQLVFVDVAFVPFDLEVIIPGGKILQGNAFIVCYTPGIIPQGSIGVVQIQVQVARPLLEVDPDVAGLPACGIQRELEPVNIIRGIDRQCRAGCGKHNVIVLGFFQRVIVISVRRIRAPFAGVPAHIQVHDAIIIDADRVIVPTEILRFSVHRAVRQQDPVFIPDLDDAVHVSDDFALVVPCVRIPVVNTLRVAHADILGIGRQLVGTDYRIFPERDNKFTVSHMVSRDHGSTCDSSMGQIQNDILSIGINCCP